MPDDYDEGMEAPFSCRYCNGQQVKIVYRGAHLWAICGNCGHQSIGRIALPIEEEDTHG